MNRIRTYHHGSYSADRIRTGRDESISVCVPTRDEASTIAGIVECLVGLRESGVIDQVVVVDADSADGTAAIAAEFGAEVVSQESLLPVFGPVRGKGDAMWRSLSVLSGDVVCFIDGDTEEFDARFVCGTVGPLLFEPDVEFTKGFFRRPMKVAGVAQPTGGGRVTALTAIPLLQAFFPQLATFHQPLAGEIASRRDLLSSIPFATGYAVETAMLLEVEAAVGVASMAQVDLDVRQNRHQPLEDLTAMAFEVLAAVTHRLGHEGRLPVAGDRLPLELRPPMETVAQVRAPAWRSNSAISR